MGKTTFIMIGAAILDVLAKPVNLSAFRVDSIPAETLTTNTGGDAMNEARRISRNPDVKGYTDMDELRKALEE